jgi:hypothetical protein
MTSTALHYVQVMLHQTTCYSGKVYIFTYLNLSEKLVVITTMRNKDLAWV